MGMTGVIEEMIGSAARTVVGEYGDRIRTMADEADRCGAGVCGGRFEVAECRARACRLFVDVVGAPVGLLHWDDTHHLQAHAHVGNRDFVLIASRDDAHEPVLLDKDDWDHVSHTFGPERAQLLHRYAIRSHV